ncbi:MAG: MMPL family transporter, partial [Candidatus Nanopelagicales bacterium]
MDLGKTPDTDLSARTRTGRKAIWLAVAVAIVWLLIGSVAGPLAGKLSEVQENDNATFLPASAESTLVSDEVANFNEDNALPLLVVVTRPDGGLLTPEDFAQAQQFVESIPSLPVGENGTVQDYLAPEPIVPIPSQDGAALLISIPLDADRATERLGESGLALRAVTESVRDAATAYPDLQINATGPAGLLTDLIAVFGAIDTTLLGATALVVAIILILVYRS